MKIKVNKRGEVRLADVPFSGTFKLIDSDACYMRNDTTHLADGVVNFDKANTNICTDLSTGVLMIFDLTLAVEVIDIKAEVLL